MALAIRPEQLPELAVVGNWADQRAASPPPAFQAACR
jgi:hypothetical protein